MNSESPPSGDNPEKSSSRSSRATVWATAGIAVIIGLAVFVAAFVGPFLQTRAVVREYANPPVVLSGWSVRPSVIEELGGSRRALRRLSLYLRLPDWLADEKGSAVRIVAYCGRPRMEISEMVGEPAEVTALPREAAAVLAGVLDHPDAKVCGIAADGLGWIGPEAKEAVPALIGALGDSNDKVRQFAAEALGKIGPNAKEAVPALEATLKDEDKYVREAAVEALEKILAAEPAPMKVLTWNIQYGADGGSDPNKWLERRKALRAALEAERPDILCVQEALAGQLAFLEKILPGYARAGVGRDDGKEKGEHCAIFFARERFERTAGGTFWLSDTPGQPSRSWGNAYVRVCTWVRLRDRASGRTLRVFNTHLPLNAPAREKSARLIAEHIGLPKKGATGPVLLAGDFNCSPGSVPWKIFKAAGLVNAEQAAGKEPGARTYHKLGLPLVCIDGVLVRGAWRVKEHRVVRGASGRVYASDHFGVAVGLEWAPSPTPPPPE